MTVLMKQHAILAAACLMALSAASYAAPPDWNKGTPEQPAGSQLLTRGTQPGVDKRHHLHRHRRRLAVSDRRARPVQPPSGGLEQGGQHANQRGDRCVA